MKRFLSVWALVCLLGTGASAQEAKFPGSIVTDADLKVSRNFVRTKLRGSVSASQTQLYVDDCSRLAANMLVTVEQEVLSITSVNSTTCQLVVQRGYDSSTAAAHNSGREVMQYVAAWDLNAMRSEIKAIQTALGAGLANISAYYPSVVSTRYDFSAQTPGGSLIVGMNVVTLTPVPAGINGGNTGHPLYIHNGTGTAEACTIQGGTAVSGAASGTVIIDCDNTHSGAWQAKSATFGSMEAAAAITNGVIYVPAGNHDFYAPPTFTKHICLVGAGQESTTLRNRGTNINSLVFDFSAGGMSGVGTAACVRDLSVIVGADATSRAAGASSGTGIRVVSANNDVSIERVGVRNHATSIQAVNSWNTPTMRDVTLLYQSVYGFHYQNNTSGGGARLESFLIGNTGAQGTISDTGAGIFYESGGGLVVANGDIQALPRGVLIKPPTGIRAHAATISNVWGDTPEYDAFVLDGTDAEISVIRCMGCWAGNAGGGSLVLDPPAVAGRGANGWTIKGSHTRNISIVGGEVRGNGRHGIAIEGGSDIRIAGDVLIVSNGQWEVGDGVNIGDGVTGVTVSGARIGNVDTIFTGGGNRYGVYAGTNANDLKITDNDLRSNVTASLWIVTSLTRLLIENNLRPDADIYETVTPTDAGGGNWTISGGPTQPDTIYVAGTNAVKTLTWGWNKHKVTLIFTNASPAGVATGGSAGGNFFRSVAAAQYEPLYCEWNTDSWYCK